MIDEKTLVNLLSATATTVVVYIALLFIKNRLYRYKNKRVILEVLNNTKWFFLAAIALYFGSFFLPEDLALIASKIVLITIVIQIGIWGNFLVAYLTSNNLIQITAKIVFWIVLILFLLDNLKFDIKTLIAGLGIGGIAVALAMQNILGDVFASASIITDKPFVVGDLIAVDSFKGHVERIGIKTTRIRSLTGEQIIFSNTELLKSRLRNYKTLTERRVTFILGLPTRTPMEVIQTVNEEVRQIIQSIPKTRFDRVNLHQCELRTYDFEVVYFVLSSETRDYMDIQEKINLELFSRFQNSRIKILN